MSVYQQDETYPYPWNQSYVQFTNSPYDLPKEVRKQIYTKDEIDKIISDTMDEIESLIIDVKPTTIQTLPFEMLPAPSADNKGSIFNIIDAFISDDKFLDGAGKEYPAGCNAIVVEVVGGGYKYDVFMGEIKTADEEDITSIIDDIYKD